MCWWRAVRELDELPCERPDFTTRFTCTHATRYCICNECGIVLYVSGSRLHCEGRPPKNSEWRRHCGWRPTWKARLEAGWRARLAAALGEQRSAAGSALEGRGRSEPRRQAEAEARPPRTLARPATRGTRCSRRTRVARWRSRAHAFGPSTWGSSRAATQMYKQYLHI